LPARSSNEVPVPPDEAEPFLALPSRAHLTACLAAGAYISVLFVVVYGGCDYMTSLHSRRVRIDFGFEQSLPFVPALSPIYSSLYLMFYAVPFVVRSRPELATYMKMVTAVTILAGIGFVLFPAEIAFRLPSDREMLPWSFRIADAINLTYNLCPSLHVGYAALHAELFRRRSPRWGWLSHLWALAIAVSAWLTYQHHLVDLVIGYVLGLLVVSTVNGDYGHPSEPTSRKEESTC
jgi:membrane-associated phospholipid phosphatase